MANDTITLMVEGEITLEVFSKTVYKFKELIEALSLEEGGQIRWVIEDLAPGSAAATIRGIADDPEKVERVGKAYINVGRALQKGDVTGPPKVVKPAKSFLRMVRKQEVATVKFETPEADAVISRTVIARRPARTKLPDSLQPQPVLAPPEPEALSTESYGAIEGTVETLARRHGLRFTLYESLTDRPISCYLQPGQEEIMRNAWGRHVIVEGRISRDATGRAIAIREVSNIIPIDEEGDFTRAKAVLPFSAGDLLPEEIIRRLRDG